MLRFLVILVVSSCSATGQELTPGGHKYDGEVISFGALANPYQVLRKLNEEPTLPSLESALMNPQSYQILPPELEQEFAPLKEQWIKAHSFPRGDQRAEKLSAWQLGFQEWCDRTMTKELSALAGQVRLIMGLESYGVFIFEDLQALKMIAPDLVDPKAVAKALKDSRETFVEREKKGFARQQVGLLAELLSPANQRKILSILEGEL